MTNTDVLGGASLERYVAIIDLFAGIRNDQVDYSNLHHDGSFGVTEISNAIGLSKGVVSRYLRRLETAGLLNRRPDRRYVLSTRVYYWGQAAKPGGDVQALARPIMEQLAKEFGEPVSLFVLAAGVAVCIDQVEGLHPVRLNAAIGRQLHLHSGASPRLLLAYASEELQEQILATAPFPQMTTSTITDADELRRELTATRERGYVLSISESNDSVVGIAAPIRDVSSNVVAAVSIAGPIDRLVNERREACLLAVQAAAESISAALGYLPVWSESRASTALQTETR
ncbi:MAG: IclR family transcriptional regulator [Thermomicrobiales bacterium]|nr:IclR family transcriptional regulator [Thermomicrobiales bacterium]